MYTFSEAKQFILMKTKYIILMKTKQIILMKTKHFLRIQVIYIISGLNMKFARKHDT